MAQVVGWSTIHYTPALPDNMANVSDVEGYIPRETILDTRATKVMISKNFSAAMGIHAANLEWDPEWKEAI